MRKKLEACYEIITSSHSTHISIISMELKQGELVCSLVFISQQMGQILLIFFEQPLITILGNTSWVEIKHSRTLE